MWPNAKSPIFFIFWQIITFVIFLYIFSNGSPILVAQNVPTVWQQRYPLSILYVQFCVSIVFGGAGQLGLPVKLYGFLIPILNKHVFVLIFYEQFETETILV